MTFELPDALPYLRCPETLAPLRLEGDELVCAAGPRYPIVDGIADLTIASVRAGAHSDYDRIAGLLYNAFIFNPLTMAVSWGPGVLRVPLWLRPARELASGVVLDVPCGTGIFTARAYKQRPDARILAVDFSLNMLRAARARARRLGVTNAVFVRADVGRLPFVDRSLDGCISMAGFHAFPDPRLAAQEIGRVLKPGAPLSASIACAEVRPLSDMVIEHVMKPRGYFASGLSPATYRDYLASGGFSDLVTRMGGAVAIMRGRRT